MKKTDAQKIEVNNDNQIPVNIIAESIVEISNAMRRINESRLNRRALLALIQDHTKLSRASIQDVLGALESLETVYLKPRKLKK